MSDLAPPPTGVFEDPAPMAPDEYVVPEPEVSAMGEAERGRNLVIRTLRRRRLLFDADLVLEVLRRMEQGTSAHAVEGAVERLLQFETRQGSMPEALAVRAYEHLGALLGLTLDECIDSGPRFHRLPEKARAAFFDVLLTKEGGAAVTLTAERREHLLRALEALHLAPPCAAPSQR